MKKLLLFVFAISFFTFGTATAQPTKDREKVTIKVPIECAACQKIIERYFKKEPGIIRLQVDYHRNVVRAIYRPSRTSASRIRNTIAFIGFDADTVKAEPYYQKRLPPCCRPTKKSDKQEKEEQIQEQKKSAQPDSAKKPKKKSFLKGIF